MPRAGALRGCGAVVPCGAPRGAPLRASGLDSGGFAGEPWPADQGDGPQRRHQVLPGGPRPFTHQRERVLQPRGVICRDAQARQSPHQLQPHGPLRPLLCRGLQQHGCRLQGAGEFGQGSQVLPQSVAVQPPLRADAEQYRRCVHNGGQVARGVGVSLPCDPGGPLVCGGLQQPGLALLGPWRPGPGPADVRTLHSAGPVVEKPLAEPPVGSELSPGRVASEDLPGAPRMGRTFLLPDWPRLHGLALLEDDESTPAGGLHLAGLLPPLGFLLLSGPHRAPRPGAVRGLPVLQCDARGRQDRALQVPRDARTLEKGHGAIRARGSKPDPRGPD
mmetsp:Transcript_25239/g.64161  ORF Transcript_25239/g.64161 Transcript_25239/m.64161 type:complete len:332 (+) Transcript_25239:393-1388(+)